MSTTPSASPLDPLDEFPENVGVWNARHSTVFQQLEDTLYGADPGADLGSCSICQISFQAPKDHLCGKRHFKKLNQMQHC